MLIRRPILFDYFDKKSKELLDKFEITKIQGSSNNIGRNREFLLEDFLKNILPPKLTYIKQGEIIDSNYHRTGQLDLIIIREDAPSLDLGGMNSYLIEGVFAVIEIKSRLDKRKLLEAKCSLKKVADLETKSQIKIGLEYALKRPLRILFAYKGFDIRNLFTLIKRNAENFSGIFDLICILDKGVYISQNGLLFLNDKKQDFAIEGRTASLAFLYYFLIQYANAFVLSSLNIGNYFVPFESWGRIIK